MEYFLLLLLYLNFHRGSSECFPDELSGSMGLYRYNWLVGTTPNETCSWTFSPPELDDSIMILNITHFRTYRLGTKENAYLTLPDGSNVHFSNQKLFIGNCLRFSRINHQASTCLENLASRYCPGPTIEVETWPPTMKSVSLTSFRTSENQPYSYDIDYTFMYIFVTSCSTSSGNYFVITVAIGAALIVVLIITTAAIALLIIRSRALTRFKAEMKKKRSLPLQTAPRSIETSELRSTQTRILYDDTSLRPDYIEVDDPTNEDIPEHDYCLVEDAANRNLARSFVVSTGSDLVDNVLYSM